MSVSWYDFFKVLIILFGLLCSGFVVSEQKYYYIKLEGDSAVLKMYVNDAEVVSKLGKGEMNYNLNANQYLVDGENKVVIDLEPYDLAAKEYDFDDELFYLDVALIKSSSEGESFLDLMNLRFDTDSQTMYQNNGPKKIGRERVNSSNTMEVLSDIKIKKYTIRYANRFSGDNSKRIVVEFSVKDADLTKPSWLDAQIINAVDGDIKEELWGAYENVYMIVKGSDKQAYKEIFHRVNEHLSSVINYGVDDFADDVLESVPLNEDGLTFGDDFYKIKEGEHFMRLSPDGKMISIIPNPLTYRNENGEYVSERAMYFCKFDDKFEVCYIYDAGY
jgi:hypothetical protein